MHDACPLPPVIDGVVVTRHLLTPSEIDDLRAAVEVASARTTARAAAAPGPPLRRDVQGHVLQTVPGDPPTAIHWEPGGRVVRDLRPVTHLDPRLDALWTDPRLTGPAAGLLGVAEVAPLTSKISFKRARVGAELAGTRTTRSWPGSWAPTRPPRS